MRRDFWYDSKGAGKIHGCCWTPEGEPRGICQIVHGIAEYVERYENFAEYLNSLGFLVIAEDHMGHGQSVNGGGIRGYFHGGWFTAVEDTYQLLKDTRAEYPQLPYVLFGHSMGSFMTRTLLITHPDSGISAAVLCGTGWLPDPALPVAEKILEKVCSKRDTTGPSPYCQPSVRFYCQRRTGAGFALRSPVYPEGKRAGENGEIIAGALFGRRG